MKEIDKQQLFEMITSTMDLYGRTVNGGVLRMWLFALQRFPIDDIRRALSMHVQNPDNGQFAPRPADVIRLIEGDTKTAGMSAWTKVEKAIRTIGSYRSVVFDDPITMAVIDEMGGWIQLCGVSSEELPFRANEFTKRYSSRRSMGKMDCPKLLTGIHDRDNAADGYGSQPPMMIGDESKCRMIYQSGGESMLQITKAVDLAGDAITQIVRK